MPGSGSSKTPRASRTISGPRGRDDVNQFRIDAHERLRERRSVRTSPLHTTGPHESTDRRAPALRNHRATLNGAVTRQGHSTKW